MDHDLQTAARQALEILKSDSVYADEYEQFVMNMSYATDAEALDFAAALNRLEEIIQLVQ